MHEGQMSLGSLCPAWAIGLEPLGIRSLTQDHQAGEMSVRLDFDPYRRSFSECEYACSRNRAD